MDVDSMIVELDAALSAQRLIGGGDPAVDTAIGAVLGVLEPAIRAAAVNLAGQAAAEVAAQLPGRRVDVVMSGNDPTLVVSEEPKASDAWSDVEARVTLRLPDELKQTIETAAKDAGDSLNAHVVKLLGRHGVKRSGERLSGTIES
ncbi:MAG: hypothetical protein HKN07_01485 [Acidimicrobiia bacterium]|nr:hypothetical protein [Acidimicrobiia bacterium]